jgi:tRNA (adenine22-N1)-methyltransferase
LVKVNCNKVNCDKVNCNNKKQIMRGNNMKLEYPALSKRLQMVVDLVPEKEGIKLAEIGCDHAYCSIYLAKKRLVKTALAMDVRKGPLQAAQENISRFSAGAYVNTRLSDGFEKLLPGEADAAMLAGMGGDLMIKLISRHFEMCEKAGDKELSCKYLILQPQTHIGDVRVFLRENGYEIKAEEMCIDAGKYYTAFMAEKNVMVLEKNVAASEKGIVASEKNMIVSEKIHEKEASEKNMIASEKIHEKEASEKNMIALEKNHKKEAAVKNNTENEVLDQYIFDTYGKILVENCNPILLEYLKKEQGQLENILKKLENSNSKESSAYAETLEKWALNEKTQKKFKKV